MSQLEKILQGNPTYEKLKKLAVFAEQKYGEDHPDVKDGDCIEVRDYLNTLFGLMVTAGVSFPPAHVGDVIYVLQPYEAEDPFIYEIEVHGVSIIETVWHVCDKDYWFIPIRPEHCFHSKEDAVAYLEKLLGGDTVG